jgi:hypothetical protein
MAGRVWEAGSVSVPGMPKVVIALSGQKLLPVLELADGTLVREDINDMVAKLKAGELPGPTS